MPASTTKPASTTNPASTTMPPTATNFPDFDKAFSSIFSNSNIILIIWFLAIYYVTYIILGILFKTSIPTIEMRITRTVDIVVFSSILILLFYSYYKLTDDEKSHILSYISTEIKREFNDPLTMVYVGFFLATLYIFIYLFRIPTAEGMKPVSIEFLETKSWIYLAILLIINFFIYVLKIPIIDLMYSTVASWWGMKPTVAPTEQSKEADVVAAGGDEVFNVSNNLYTYDDAQAVCSAYGARLANYDEIEDAYNKGAEWCNYGWSDNQMAFFPTQKETWNKLQKVQKLKNNCGRPGVNGGFMANPNLKFGVNCYGKKPAPRDSDMAMLAEKQNQIVPKTPEQVELEQKIKFWKDNSDKLLNINSYNQKKWSQY
jgi:hypothetical protein